MDETMNVIDFKEAKCKNCYKCIRACEVKAITVKNEQAQILNDKCILCGHCMEVCPQNAKTFSSDLEMVKGFLAQGIPTIISLAPSYLGILKYQKPGQVVAGLKRLGFSQVRETAEGAVYVTEEYNRLLQEGTMENIITTCCPSANDLIEIYYPELVKYMAPVVSPMIAHGKVIKNLFGDQVKVVFLGPCLAKKREALNDARTAGYIDAVLHFFEFEDWLREEGIELSELPEEPFDNPNPEVNRLYPVSSGVLSAVVADGKQDSYRKFYVHGMKNATDLLDSMNRGDIKGSFIELNICNGGCIKGPAVDRESISRFKVKLDMEEQIAKVPPKKEEFMPPKAAGELTASAKLLEKPQEEREELSFAKAFQDRSPKDAVPTEEEIRAILRKIGKTEPEHELNCGACGYSTCREKAVAVFQKKAELYMCIPYMHERAESMSNFVLDTTPNIILVVDPDMKIIEFNHAARKYFHLTYAEALDKYLFELIDHSDFEEVMRTKQNILGKKVRYEDLGITTSQDIVYMKKQDAVLGIFQDITKEEEAEKQSYQLKVETIEMAQAVIDRQMTVAQEIAGLLGETTAETKVTLTKLRDMILGEETDIQEGIG